MSVRTFVSWVLKRRLFVLIIWSILVVLASLQLIRFLSADKAPIDNSVSIWFQQNDPELLQYRQFNKDFGEAEWTILLLKTAIDGDQSIIEHLVELAENIESIPHVQKAISVADFLSNPISSPISKEDENVVQRSFQVPENLRLNGILYNEHDAEHFAILVKVDNLIDTRSKYRIHVLDQIRKLVSTKAWIRDHALAGTLVVNAELNRAAEHNAIMFYFLIAGLLILLSLLTLKYYRDTLLLIAIVAGTVFPIMAGLSLYGNSYNMLTIMLPTMLAAFSVADIVHIIDHFHQKRTQACKGCTTEKIYSSINRSAIVDAMELVWKPGLWTSLTTAIGLLGLCLSSVIPVFQIGVAGPIGILWAWIQTVIVGPALLSLLWNSSGELQVPVSFKSTMQSAYQRIVIYLIGLHSRHQRKLLLGLCLMALPITALPWLEVDTNYAKFFRADSILPADYRKLESAGLAQNPLSVQITIKANKDISSNGIYHKIEQFESKIESLKPVIGLFSASVPIENLTRSLTLGNPKFDDIAVGRQHLAAQILNTAKQENYREFEDFITEDGRLVQIFVMTNYLSSKQLDALKAEIMNSASMTFSQAELSVLITGTTVLWASMDGHISRTQLHSIIFSFFFMGLLLPFILKSFKLGLLAIIINFLPVSISLGVMALVDIKVNMATALIGSIAFGIVVDDTIHFLMRFNYNRTLGIPVNDSIEESTMIIGRSIITTSLILIGSFITLASSSFLPSAHFGIFIALSVSLALYLDIFVLPLLLRFIYRNNINEGT